MIDYSKVLSDVIVSTPKSGIRKFFDLLENMQDVVALTVGQPDLESESARLLRTQAVFPARPCTKIL